MNTYLVNQKQVDNVIAFRDELVNKYHSLSDKNNFKNIIAAQVLGIEITLLKLRIEFKKSNIEYILEDI